MLIPLLRGVPLGFLNRLEARLAETEQALFMMMRASSTLEQPDSATIATLAASREDKVEEWDRLPLKTMADLQAWYYLKASNAILTQDTQHNSRATIQSPSTNAEERDLESEVQEPITASPTIISVGVDSEMSEGRIAELQATYPNMYF